MVIIGAKGHAKELLVVIKEKKITPNSLYFFDNVSEKGPSDYLGFRILSTFEEIIKLFEHNNEFTLGLGSPIIRRKLAEKFLNLGGDFISVISKKTVLGENIELGNGCNIMPFSSVYNDVKIGQGVLVNSYSSVHHDSIIGEFVEISPGARILGRTTIGSFCAIGSNSVILPGIKITSHVIIGAGSVVTKNINEPGVYVGVPAKKIK